MMEEKTELVGGVEIAEDVKRRIKNTGVRYLDFEEAERLGIFKRISDCMTVIHQCVTAAYMTYGIIDNTLSMIGGKKTEIKKACNDVEKAFEKFITFFSDYYTTESTNYMMIDSNESFFLHIMKWLNLPVEWNAGDPLRLDDDSDTAIRVSRDEQNLSDLTFHRCTVYEELIDEPKESWCVTKYNERERKQEAVHTEMDKASALMVAKRLSDEDRSCYYTASLVQEKDVRKIEVIPYKAFFCNNTVGSIIKVSSK